jgi:hypothetical protein
MKNELDELIKSKGQYIHIYQGIESVDDPFEKNVSTTNLNPLPVKALVVDFVASKAQWVMPGIKVSRIKEIYVPRKYRSLLENSQKIEIRNSDGQSEFYEGWRENGHMQLREEGGYLRVYIYSKHT